MKLKLALLILLICTVVCGFESYAQQTETYSMEQIKSYPFPNQASVSAASSKIVFALNQNGVRNLYVASAPNYNIAKLTSYNLDDGQDLSSVKISTNGERIVYIRGGDFGSNWDDAKPVNPTFNPESPEVHIWSIPYSGGQAVDIGLGENPIISSDGKAILFQRNGQLYLSPSDGKTPARQLFYSRGRIGSAIYSPNGKKLAFVSSRGDHSFVGIYEEGKPIQWLDPSFYRDHTPKWSPGGESLIFIRSEPRGGEPQPILIDQPSPWSIISYHLIRSTVKTLWTSPSTKEGRLPTTHGRVNLNCGEFITFLSYHDGWPHLYRLDYAGGNPELLTPGDYMAEYVSMGPNGKFLYFSGNTGNNKEDIDRRHVVQVNINNKKLTILSPGIGNEWSPLALANNQEVFIISAGAKRPPLPAIINTKTKKIKILGENLISNYPSNNLVTPKQVIYTAPDGSKVHATLFINESVKIKNRPAVIYVHGGPPRQMLLGWHYSSYYSNAYAVNQYLASRGFAVLSINYRLGIGYGYQFHRPEDGGSRGASEYQDVLAGAKWLQEQEFIDRNKIGIYGGSYGGYLTAMALARNSDLFKAGVDIHGVHDRTINRTNNYYLPNRFEKAPDANLFREIAWKSSPIANMDTWTSPVLIIHGDDDRNVDFSQSVDLIKRLRSRNVAIETLVIVDDTHHFMMHSNQLKVNKVTAEYLIRKLFD